MYTFVSTRVSTYVSTQVGPFVRDSRASFVYTGMSTCVSTFVGAFVDQISLLPTLCLTDSWAFSWPSGLGNPASSGNKMGHFRAEPENQLFWGITQARKP